MCSFIILIKILKYLIRKHALEGEVVTSHWFYTLSTVIQSSSKFHPDSCQQQWILWKPAAWRTKPSVSFRLFISFILAKQDKPYCSVVSLGSEDQVWQWIEKLQQQWLIWYFKCHSHIFFPCSNAVPKFSLQLLFWCERKKMAFIFFCFQYSQINQNTRLLF